MMTFWEDLATTPLALLVREAPWAYPILETAHILGLGLLFGAVFMMDLRLLGLSRRLPASLMARHLLPWAWAGFAINAVSGALLFLSDAPDFAASGPFRVKMALIVLAGLNAALFHARVYRSITGWDLDKTPPPAARLAAAVSMMLWLGVIAAGRMIAYFE